MADDKGWTGTNVVIGYISDEVGPDSSNVPIQAAWAIKADESLKRKQIDINLDILKANDYPGEGTHNVLVAFSAKHKPDTLHQQKVNFNHILEAREKQKASEFSYPIFRNLTVPSDGLWCELKTVNISNNDDLQLLELLKSDEVRDGLMLASSFQPGLAPFVKIGLQFAEKLAARNQNKGVLRSTASLGFSATITNPKLRTGSYIWVQVPGEDTSNWSWKDWVWDANMLDIRRVGSQNVILDANYVIIGISLSE